MAAVKTATPLANSSRATLRSACSRARCCLIAGVGYAEASLPSCGFIPLLRRIANTGSQLCDNLLRCAFSRFVFAHIERNGADPRVSAAAISLAHLRQIHGRRG